MAKNYTTEVPKDWKTFEDFSTGLGTYRLPATEELEGSEYTFNLGEKTLNLKFGKKLVSWSCENEKGEEEYEAIVTAPDTYYVNFLYSAKQIESQVLVFNVKTLRVISVVTYVKPGDIKGEPRMGQNFVAGTIAGGTPSGFEPGPTRDLIGQKALYTYSENHTYEHYYINTENFCWQNLKGVQYGNADIEPATYWKFDDQQYVFGWTEKIIPCAPVWFVNFEQCRETGIFLNATEDGTIETRPGGAHIQKLLQTFYPNHLRVY